ncbi:MAG: CehA/McbA family metallohydrolase [Candidatus Solibacter usitatus]|nr:CehA/McbA family metallohydrolase [Candidatus Solibacter usitatus]
MALDALTSRRDFMLSAAPVLLDGRPLEVRIVDKDSGRPVPARVRLLAADGSEVVPLGHAPQLAAEAQQGDVRFQSKRFAYVDGVFQVRPEMLPLRYQVIKGYEYGIAEGVLTPERARAGTAEIAISRWSHLSRRQWYGGDIHIHHISPKTCRLEMEAEDLDVANILTSDFTTDQQEFEGRLNANSSRDRLIYVSQEFRHNHLGHMCLLNLKRTVEPVKTMQTEHYPLLLEACDNARAQGGYVSWAHFPSWPGLEGPLDVAMEKLDGLEILSVLDPHDFPVFMQQVVPEVEANNGLRLWYRYLNCGFRLTATAGTDKMTSFVTVGANRVYAKMERDFTYANWIQALKQGRTFITNSPVLAFTVNGSEAGGTIAIEPGKRNTVRVHARAESQLTYDRLEIVVNGNTVAQSTPSGPKHVAEIHLEFPVTKSCWIAARSVEDSSTYRARKVDFRAIHAAEGTRLGDYYGTRRPETVFAHSSPVYVIRGGKAIRNHDDAQYYVRYLNAASAWLEKQGRFLRPSDRKATLDAFEQGRAVYRRRAEEALTGDR